MDSIFKIFLVDPRYSDQRREVTFDRQTDDWGKVQSTVMLKLRAAPDDNARLAYATVTL